MSGDTRVYLGLGSNQNKPQRQLTLAIGHINRLSGTRIIEIAPQYQTKAWGVTDQPDFINTVIAIDTKLKPLALLKKIKAIEYRLMGRKKNRRWHSRCIDIDILYYANKPYQRSDLELPHPFMQQRNFVLKPLLDTNPDWLPLAVRRKIVLKKSRYESIYRLNNQLANNKTQKIVISGP